MVYQQRVHDHVFMCLASKVNCADGMRRLSLAIMHPRCRLYIDSALAAAFSPALSEDQAHYLRHVMRAKDGDIVRLFNGRDGAWDAEVSLPGKRGVSLQVMKQQEAQRSVPNMIVCIAPIKSGRFENAVEKATELGARRIMPVMTQRTVMGRVNEARLAATAREAAEQCERLDVPDVAATCDFKLLLANWPKDIPLIYGDESGASEPFAVAAYAPQAKQNGWGILVGPEGGFSPEELDLLRAQSFAHGVSLGPRILRADTACTILCAMSMQQFGDFHERPAFSSRHAD